MATLKCKGLTGVVFDITVTMGSTTMDQLTALAQAVEGQEITTAEYEDIAATKNLTINQTNNGSDTLTAAGLVDGDMVQCIPLGRTTTRFKRQRQESKLKIAVTKRMNRIILRKVTFRFLSVLHRNCEILIPVLIR